jgi:hypothetical protein
VLDFLKFGLVKNLMTQAAGHVVVWLLMLISNLPSGAKIGIGLAVAFLQLVFSGLASYFNSDGTPQSVAFKPNADQG